MLSLRKILCAGSPVRRCERRGDVTWLPMWEGRCGCCVKCLAVLVVWVRAAAGTPVGRPPTISRVSGYSDVDQGRVSRRAGYWFWLGTKRIHWCISCEWWETLMLHVHYIYWELYCRQMCKTFYWLGGMIRCRFSCKGKISVNYIVYRNAEERVHSGGMSMRNFAGPWRLGGTQTDRPWGHCSGWRCLCPGLICASICVGPCVQAVVLEIEIAVGGQFVPPLNSR